MAGTSRARPRGNITELPSGSLRVRVYAGKDPLTGRATYLTETVKPGRKAAAEAERVRTRLQRQADEQLAPPARATLGQLLDRYLEVVDVEPSTKQRYAQISRVHLRPALGSLPLTKVDAALLDRFYAQLRICRERCGGRGHQRHRTNLRHTCDERCRAKDCRPLSASSIRAAHWVLSAAFGYAVRWRWLSQSPIEAVKPPSPARLKPSPPSPVEAARLIGEAFRDEDWGAFVWTAVTTGARRGELCALQRHELDLEHAVLTIRAGLKRVGGRHGRRDTKTHQQRRVALDAETVQVLAELLARQDAEAARLGVVIGPKAFLFSPAPDASTPLNPDTATQRYQRMASRLGICTTLHKLRHYSATELIAAGVDIRTVAGRLGHGGGGATTLKAYAAWVTEADQRAARVIAGRALSGLKRHR